MDITPLPQITFVTVPGLTAFLTLPGLFKYVPTPLHISGSGMSSDSRGKHPILPLSDGAISGSLDTKGVSTLQGHSYSTATVLL